MISIFREFFINYIYIYYIKQRKIKMFRKKKSIKIVKKKKKSVLTRGGGGSKNPKSVTD